MALGQNINTKKEISLMDLVSSKAILYKTAKTHLNFTLIKEFPTMWTSYKESWWTVQNPRLEDFFSSLPQKLGVNSLGWRVGTVLIIEPKAFYSTLYNHYFIKFIFRQSVSLLKKLRSSVSWLLLSAIIYNLLCIYLIVWSCQVCCEYSP